MEHLAESVRCCDSISGIHIGGYNYIIGLFADDVVLTLTNPASSLANVQFLLDTFGSVSHYKLNTTKSCIMPIGDPKNLKAQLKLPFPFQWPLKTYPILESLYHMRPPPLISQIFPIYWM